MPFIVFALDADGVFTASDGEGLSSLGLDPGEVVGRSAFEVYRGEPEVLENLERALLGESFSSVVAVGGRAFRCRYYPLRGEGGGVIGAVGLAAEVAVLRSMSEGARIKESEERFRLTFESAGVGMAHVAPDGRWLRINGKLAEITGFAREELLSKTFQDITHPADLEKSQEHARRMIAGEIDSYSMEKRYVRKDGRRVWAELTVSALRAASGELACFVSVIEDITERKLKELIPDPLTPREVAVLRLVVEGRTNSQVATSIAHSVGTVKLDLHRIIGKLGVKNRRDAAIRAVEMGLVPPIG